MQVVAVHTESSSQGNQSILPMSSRQGFLLLYYTKKHVLSLKSGYSTELLPYSFLLLDAEFLTENDSPLGAEYAVRLTDEAGQMPLPSQLGIAAQVVLTISSEENAAFCELLSLLAHYVRIEKERSFEQFAVDNLMGIIVRRLQILTLSKTILTEADSNTAVMVTLREQIYREPTKNWNIDEMCEQVRLSRAHLQRVYSDTFGCSCYQDVLQSRLSRADFLLTKSSAPICSIAQQCGFDSDSTFIRAFKKSRGCTPTAFRQANMQ